ncbi:hypothetical protein CCP3SC15_1820001 [Gammaproteobacteria bacterium]
MGFGGRHRYGWGRVAEHPAEHRSGKVPDSPDAADDQGHERPRGQPSPAQCLGRTAAHHPNTPGCVITRRELKVDTVTLGVVGRAGWRAIGDFDPEIFWRRPEGELPHTEVQAFGELRRVTAQALFALVQKLRYQDNVRTEFAVLGGEEIQRCPHLGPVARVKE